MVDPISAAAIGGIVGTAALKFLTVEALRTALEPVAGHLKTKMKGLAGEAIFDYEVAARRTQQYRMVKTLRRSDKSVDIEQFMVALPMRVGSNSDLVLTTDPDDFWRIGKQVVLIGVAGQGKSILVRYLASQPSLGRVSVFVRLRHMDDSANSVIALVQTELRALGAPEISAQPEAVERMMAIGLIDLYLDGFDELDPELRGKCAHEIEQLTRQHAKLRILLTSRPGSQAEWLSTFRKVSLARLRGQEVDAIIHKLSTQASDIISKRQVLGDGVLSTPLMVNLLVYHYSVRSTLPETLIAFYDGLFEMMLREHDGTKIGYTRNRQSTATDALLRNAFEALSWLSAQAGMQDFTKGEAHRLLEDFLGASESPEGAEAIFDDLNKVTNLIVRDGQKFTYPHRSIQEFYAAACINSGSSEQVIDLIGELLANPRQHSDLIGVMRFLAQMRPVFCAEHLVIPALRRLHDHLAERVSVFEETRSPVALSGLVNEISVSEGTVETIGHGRDWVHLDAVRFASQGLWGGLHRILFGGMQDHLINIGLANTANYRAYPSEFVERDLEAAESYAEHCVRPLMRYLQLRIEAAEESVRLNRRTFRKLFAVGRSASTKAKAPPPKK